MAKKEKKVDAYIAKSADFAKPILNHLRNLVHITCEGVEEKIKWGFPHFDYKNGPMCSMAAFKQHAVFGFWKAPLMKNGKSLVEKAKSEEAMGHFGKLSTLKDLPSDKILIAYIKEAMLLNEEGIKLGQKKANEKEKKEISIPDYFTKALSKNKKAEKTFTEFSYSHKKEYLQWVAEAKTEETQLKRLAQAVEWISEGKERHWKYKK